MRYTLFNDLIASVRRDASTSANVIRGLFSRHSNVILGKAERHKGKQDEALSNLEQTTWQLKSIFWCASGARLLFTVKVMLIWREVEDTFGGEEANFREGPPPKKKNN